MSLIGQPLPKKIGEIDREFYIEHWLASDNDVSVKVAAFEYLKHNGEFRDLDAVREEFNRAKQDTSRAALEAIIGIQLRYKIEDALAEEIINAAQSSAKSAAISKKRDLERQAASSK